MAKVGKALSIFTFSSLSLLKCTAHITREGSLFTIHALIEQKERPLNKRNYSITDGINSGCKHTQGMNENFEPYKWEAGRKLYFPLSVNIGVLLKHIIVQFQNCWALITKRMVEQNNRFTISFNPPNLKLYRKKRSPSSSGFISLFQSQLLKSIKYILRQWVSSRRRWPVVGLYILGFHINPFQHSSSLRLNRFERTHCENLHLLRPLASLVSWDGPALLWNRLQNGLIRPLIRQQ